MKLTAKAQSLRHPLKQALAGLDTVFEPEPPALASLRAKIRIGMADALLATVAAPLQRALQESAPGLRRQELASEHYKVVMRRGHPAAGDFTLDTWLAHPHVVVSPRGDARGTLDDVLLRLGLQRHIGLVLPSFTAALHVVASTDLIAMVPSRSLTDEDASWLTIYSPPVPVETFPLHLAWHERNDNNPAHAHVRALLREAIA